jgi:hypothetical protein
VPADVRSSFADELDGLGEEHRTPWRARNRPGGLDESGGRLTRLATTYRAP